MGSSEDLVISILKEALAMGPASTIAEKIKEAIDLLEEINSLGDETETETEELDVLVSNMTPEESQEGVNNLYTQGEGEENNSTDGTLA